MSEADLVNVLSINKSALGQSSLGFFQIILFVFEVISDSRPSCAAFSVTTAANLLNKSYVFAQNKYCSVLFVIKTQTHDKGSF